MARLKHRNDKEFHISRYYDNARSRAIEKNIPFNITQEYLREIATDHCPIFNIEFKWGRSGLGKGKQDERTPQLDCVIPELGYVVGNVAFISGRANRIKDNGTMDEHYAIADWIWEHHHAQQESTTSVSNADSTSGQVYSELGAILTSGFGEDDDDFDNYCRAIFRPNFGHSAEKSSGKCLGAGGDEVEPPEASAYIQGIRYSYTKVVRHLNRVGYLYRKFRERCLADGTRPDIPELGHRRK